MIFKNLISKNRGFTLIEMLVVLAVLAALLGLVSPNISLIAERANQAVGNMNAKTFKTNAIYDLALNNKSGIRISETVDLTTVGEVDDVIANYSGTDTLKLLISTDRGDSWHSYNVNQQASLKDMFGGYVKANGLKWGLIDHSKKENVRKRGLSVNGLNNIEKNTWLEMLEGKNSVTFGFNATDSEGEDVTWTTNPSLNIEVIGSNKTENVGFPKVDKSDLALRFKGLTDKTVDENTLFSYQLNATNPHDKELTYSIVNSGELPVGLSINSIGLIEWDIGYEDEGNYIVEVQVTDGNLSDTASFNLIVNDINRPPESLSVSDQTIIEGHNLNFSVGSSDPDGDILTYTSSNLPSGASLDSSTGVFDWTPSLSQAGSYEITINTSDGSTTTSDSFTITVNDNAAPTMLDVSDQTITTDDTLNVTLSANDSQGEELTFTASGLPEGASFDSSNGNISWSSPSIGSWNIEITAEDEVGQNVSRTFGLTVEEKTIEEFSYNVYAKAAQSTSDYKTFYLEKGTTVSWSATLNYGMARQGARYPSAKGKTSTGILEIIDPSQNIIVRKTSKTNVERNSNQKFNGSFVAQTNGLYKLKVSMSSFGSWEYVYHPPLSNSPYIEFEGAQSAQVNYQQ